MADDRKHIDQFFKDYLSGYKAKAPAGAWERLQTDLEPSKKRRPFMYFRLAAASLLLLTAFTAGYFWSEFKNPEIIVPATEVAKIDVQKPAPEKPIENLSSQTLPAENNKVSNSEKSEFISSDHEIQKIEPSLIAKNQIKPDVEKKGSGTGQEQEQLVSAEQENNLKTGVVPAGDETTGTAQNVDEMRVLPESLEQDKKIAEPEIMSPEMLHQLLVGNDDALAYEIIDKSKAAQPQQWSVGGQFSPVYSFRTLSGQGFSTPDERVDQSYYNNSEAGLMAFAGGISLDYGFNDRLSLASGLYLSRIGQVNNDVVAYDSPDSQYLYKLSSSSGTVTINPQKFEKVMLREIDNTKDSVPGDYLVNGSFVQNFDYLEVPFVLKYKLLKNRFSVNLSGGLSPGILVNNRSYFNVDGEKVQTGYTENIKPVIYNSVMGLGIEYSLSSKVSINLDPLFKYSLSPINSNSGLKYHPYSVSFFTGVTYKL